MIFNHEFEIIMGEIFPPVFSSTYMNQKLLVAVCIFLVMYVIILVYTSYILPECIGNTAVLFIRKSILILLADEHTGYGKCEVCIIQYSY